MSDYRAVFFDLDGTLLDVDMNVFLSKYFRMAAGAPRAPHPAGAVRAQSDAGDQRHDGERRAATSMRQCSGRRSRRWWGANGPNWSRSSRRSIPKTSRSFRR